MFQRILTIISLKNCDDKMRSQKFVSSSNERPSLSLIMFLYECMCALKDTEDSLEFSWNTLVTYILQSFLFQTDYFLFCIFLILHFHQVDG